VQGSYAMSWPCCKANTFIEAYLCKKKYYEDTMFLVPSHNNKENNERIGNLQKFQRLLSMVLEYDLQLQSRTWR